MFDSQFREIENHFLDSATQLYEVSPAGATIAQADGSCAVAGVDEFGDLLLSAPFGELGDVCFGGSYASDVNGGEFRLLVQKPNGIWEVISAQ